MSEITRQLQWRHQKECRYRDCDADAICTVAISVPLMASGGTGLANTVTVDLEALACRDHVGPLAGLLQEIVAEGLHDAGEALER